MPALAAVTGTRNVARLSYRRMMQTRLVSSCMAALVSRAGVGTVWPDGSGKHSSDPQHRRCGVG
eukprot:629738-Amphidinium_carterae.1